MWLGGAETLYWAMGGPRIYTLVCPGSGQEVPGPLMGPACYICILSPGELYPQPSPHSIPDAPPWLF
jgi:hypothetical protein